MRRILEDLRLEETPAVDLARPCSASQREAGGGFIQLKPPVGEYRRPFFGIWRFAIRKGVLRNEILWSDDAGGSLYGVCFRLCPRQVLGFSWHID